MEKGKDSPGGGFGVRLVLFAIVLFLAVLASWTVAWKVESRHFDAYEEQLSESFAWGFICEEVTTSVCPVFRGSQTLQEYQWIKARQPNRVPKMAAAARSAFIFPWPWVGVTFVLTVIALVVATVDRSSRSKHA